MFKNKKYFLFILLIVTYVPAQIGINTEQPSAMLHVKPNSLEDDNNNDKNIPLLNLTNHQRNSVLKLDELGKLGINCNNPDKYLDINGNLRIRDLKNILTISNKDSYDRVLAADSIGNVGFVPMESNFQKELPEIKTIKYVYKSVKLDENTLNTSVTELGNIRIRYNYYTRDNVNNSRSYIEFRTNEDSHYAVFYKKNGLGANPNSGSNGTSELKYYQNEVMDNLKGGKAKGKWIRFSQNFNALLRDIGTAYILLNDTRHIYRVTFISNDELPESPENDITEKVEKRITIFLEQLIGKA